MYRPSTQPRTRRDYEDIARYERSLAFHNGLNRLVSVLTFRG